MDDRDCTEQGPVFIGGPHRSGTGMLRAVLGSNSCLAIPPKEYQFFETFGASFSGADAEAAAKLRALLQWPKVREWGLGHCDPEAMLCGTDRSLRAVYAAPLLAYAASSGKPRFGEKTPFLERHFETLLDWFGPGMRFVQIIRDPLPTYASLCRQDGIRRIVDPVVFARRWRASAARGLRYGRLFPHQFRLIRYEDFVFDPQTVVRELCAFCALPLEADRMLSMQDFARKRNSSFAADEPARRHLEIVNPVTGKVAGVSRLDKILIDRELEPIKTLEGWSSQELPELQAGDDSVASNTFLGFASTLVARVERALG